MITQYALHRLLYVIGWALIFTLSIELSLLAYTIWAPYAAGAIVLAAWWTGRMEEHCLRAYVDYQAKCSRT